MTKYKPCTYCKKKPQAMTDGDVWTLDHMCEKDEGGRYHLGAFTLKELIKFWNDHQERALWGPK